MKNNKFFYSFVLLFVVLLTASLFACMGGQKVVINILEEDGTEITQLKGRAGESMDFTPPTDEYQNFDGFYLDQECTLFFSKNLVEFPRKSVTLYAKFSARVLYKLSFNTDGGTTIKSSDVFSGENLDQYQPSAPTKNGYIFGGWMLDKSQGQMFNFSSNMPHSDLVLYAKWAKDPQKKFFKFYLDDKIYSEVPLDKDEAITRPDQPKLDSSTIFDDWYTTPTGMERASFDTVIDFDKVPLDDEGAYCLYGNYYSKGLSISDGVVTGYNGTASSITIPWVFGDTLVTKISSGVFEYKKIKSLIIGDTVQTISSRAFYGCSLLTSVRLPKNLESMEEYAFGDCVLLESIQLPDNANVDFNSAFLGCESLATIQIDDSNQFYTSISSGVYSKDGETFIKCAPATQEFSVKDGTKIIAENAIDSKKLKTLIIPDSVTDISRGAIRPETSGLEQLTLPAVVNCQYQTNNQISSNQLYQYQTNQISSNQLYQYQTNQISSNQPYQYQTQEFTAQPYTSEAVEIFSLAVVFGAQSYFDNMGSNIYINSLFVPKTLVSVTISSASAELIYSFYGCAYIKNIVLPNEGIDYIGAGTFFLCSSLEEIVIPDSVSAISGGSIETAAFYYCTSLTKVTLPTIFGGYFAYIFGASVYYDMLSLGGVIIPFAFYVEEVSITSSQLDEIDAGAFYGLNKIRKISFNSKVKSIADRAFFDCTSLETIEGLQFVEELKADNQSYSGAFAYCYNLKNFSLPSLNKGIIGKEAFLAMGIYGGLFNFVIGEGVQAIEEFAFMDCSTLVDISIPSSVMYIGYGSFYNCASVQMFKIPASVMYIAPSAFEQCVSLQSLELPLLANIEYLADGQPRQAFVLPLYFGASAALGNKYIIGSNQFQYVPRSLKSVSFNYFYADVNLDYSFYDCEFIEKINLPDQLISIGKSTFYGCRALQLLSIPNSVQSIDESAFAYCVSLAGFELDGDSEYFSVIDGVLYSGDKTRLICYPGGKRGDSFHISEQATYIESFAFSGNPYIKTVFLPPSLVSVGSAIFQNCPLLSTVVAGGEVFDATQLNNGMLVGKTDNRLYGYFGQSTTVILPSNIVSIAPHAFASLKYLTYIYVDKNVSSIGEFSFADISAEVEFSEQSILEQIEKNAFYGYLGTDISLPKNLKYISDSAFENSMLTSITLPKTLISIGDYAFFASSQLSELNIPQDINLISIGSAAFAQCAIKMFDTPKSLVSIGDYAFAHNKLEYFDSSGSDLENIGKYSFYANSLQIINITGKINTISEGAFASNAPLYDLVIDEGVKIIEDFAFNADTRAFGESNPLCVLSIINIPASIEYIGEMAFYGAGHYAIPSGEEGIYWYFTSEVRLSFASGSALKEIGANAFGMIKLGETLDLRMTSLETIAAYAFCNPVSQSMTGRGHSLKSVLFPSSLRVIGEGAFLGQMALAEITLPESIQSIGDFAFYHCLSLKRVILSSSQPPEIGTSSIEPIVNIYVPNEALDEYLTLLLWQEYQEQLLPMSSL